MDINIIQIHFRALKMSQLKRGRSRGGRKEMEKGVKIKGSESKKTRRGEEGSEQVVSRTTFFLLGVRHGKSD